MLVGVLGAGAVVLLGWAIRHLARTHAPLVQLSVLREQTLRISVTAGSIYRMVITAVPFLLPLQFQFVFGWTPLSAGLMVAALFAGNLTIKPATTPLMRRFGIRNMLLVNGIHRSDASACSLRSVRVFGSSRSRRFLLEWRAAVHRLHRVLQSGVLRHRG